MKIFSMGSLGDFSATMTADATDSPTSSPVGGQVSVGDVQVATDYVTPPDSGQDDDFGRPSVSDVGDFTVTAPITHRVVLSQKSMVGTFNTMFKDFDLTARPVYNFFVEDEETNDREQRDQRAVSEIPRYILLRWRAAPFRDLKIKDVTTKATRTPSSLEDLLDGSAFRDGITYVSSEADELESAIQSLANGYYSPAVIDATVESGANSAPTDPASKLVPKIDEQLYLSSDETDGVTIEDIESSLLSIYGGLQITDEMSDDLVTVDDIETEDLFASKFSISSDIVTNDYLISDVAPASPSMEIALTTPDMQGSDPVGTELMKAVALQSLSEEDAKLFTEISFIDPGVTGLISEEKVDSASSPEHAESIASLAQFIPSLSMIPSLFGDIRKRDSIPSFPATEDQLGLKYIGYLIEKYEQGSNGVFSLVERITVPGSHRTGFLDSRVKYGKVYRYRMRSIMRWARKAGNISSVGTGSPSSPYISSYFASPWSRGWRYALVIDNSPPPPPDELTVRPESFNKRIVVTFKVPDNSQRDISFFKLFRKLIDESGNDITGWIDVGIFPGPRNGLYIDGDVSFVEDTGLTYVYSAQTFSRHNERSLLSCQIGACVTKDFRRTGEKPVVHHSGPGASHRAVGALSRVPVVRKKVKNVAHERIILTPRQGVSRRPHVGSTIVMRIESLDTGEKFDHKFEVNYLQSQEPRVIESTSVVTTGFREAPNDGSQTTVKGSVSTIQTAGAFSPSVVGGN